MGMITKDNEDKIYEEIYSSIRKMIDNSDDIVTPHTIERLKRQCEALVYSMLDEEYIDLRMNYDEKLRVFSVDIKNKPVNRRI